MPSRTGDHEWSRDAFGALCDAVEQESDVGAHKAFSGKVDTGFSQENATKMTDVRWLFCRRAARAKHGSSACQRLWHD